LAFNTIVLPINLASGITDGLKEFKDPGEGKKDLDTGWQDALPEEPGTFDKNMEEDEAPDATPNYQAPTENTIMQPLENFTLPFDKKPEPAVI